MTTDEELRARLRAADPLRPRRDVDPLPSPSAAEIRERVMQTINQPDNVKPEPAPAPARNRWQVLAATAAAVVVVASAAVAGWIASGDSGDGGKAPTTVSLKVQSSGVMASCAALGPADPRTSPDSIEFLRDMPVAFAGTVTAATEDAVTLDVDRWYKGGTADQVRVTKPDPQSSIALEGVEFVQGKRYFVTASDGTVNGCGFSGEATAELEKAFTEAFPS